MTLHAKLAATIDSAFEDRAKFAPGNAPADVIAAVEAAIDLLDRGTARVAEKIDGQWRVHEWLKKAVLLSFRLNDNRPVDAGYTNFYDKVPLKYTEYDAERFRRDGVRVVPPAVVRRGAYVAGNAVLMPSYVNIGAYVGEGTMVDTWATVGSCAQIGRHVHLSGGVGIGGVLEPLQASPTIIEDHCFIGARSEVVEGVIVEEGACCRWASTSARARGSTTRTRRGPVRPHSRRRRRRARQPAGRERQVQPLLRRDRQARGRADPGKGRNQ